jgi:hypothetical protein
MQSSYAIKWREPNGDSHVGRLELGPRALRLVGDGVERQFGYEELSGLRIGHDAAERVDGRRSVVLERANGPYHLTSSAFEAGVLHEVVDRLADLREAAPRRAVVVVPLKPGTDERVRGLAATGPPFEPLATALTGHQLLLTPREAIFIFETADERGLETLLGHVDLWAAAASWGEVIAGPPRVAEIAYSWERPVPSA